MEAYLAAKQLLFAQADVGIVNLDDPAAQAVIDSAAGKTVSYSIEKYWADFTAKNVKIRNGAIEYELVGDGQINRVRFATPARFSVYNSMAAVACAVELGVPFLSATEPLAAVRGVPGRMETVPTQTDYTVVIDYAHTPDALENVLCALREVADGRILCVFGCGGERDRAKRPLMGEIATRLADAVFITSDNPRGESQQAIFADILAGIPAKRKNYTVHSERTLAIETALQHAQAGDFVLLAGKGQETYQILPTGKIHYDEREVVRALLQGGSTNHTSEETLH